MMPANEKIDPCPQCGRQPWITAKVRRARSAYCGYADCHYAGAVDAPDLDSLLREWNKRVQRYFALFQFDRRRRKKPNLRGK